jgi:hypothetical protein
MGFPSTPELLVLHAVRVMGMPDELAIARRTGLDPPAVAELLLDEEACGFVGQVAFADVSGWALTDAGRAEDSRRVADELARSGCRSTISAVNDAFAEVNTRFLATVTDWQIRPQPWDRMAANDHTDWRWDDRVLDELQGYLMRLRPLCAQLTAALDRFGGYDERYAAALARVAAGERSWVDEPGTQSCHRVWIELHEDLLSTLGLR